MNPSLDWMMGGGGAVVGLAITAVAAAADTALDEANRVHVRELAEGGWRKAAVQRLIQDPQRAWLTVLVLNLAGVIVATLGWLRVVTALGWGPSAALVSVIGFGTLVTVAGQLIPRAWAARHPESAALGVALMIDGAARVVDPLVGFAARRMGVQPPQQTRTIRDDELRALLNVDEDDSPIEADEIEMITGIIELGDTEVHEVMVPRIDIVAVPITATLDEALDTIIRAGHSRIPVYRETIDDIAGLLYAKDLLRALRSREFDADIAGFLREPHFVPESKRVDSLLAELQSQQVHMAIVVDEYGGTAGLATIEDLLEEIVGEIRDEYDPAETPVERLGPGEVVVDAGLNIHDVNRMLDIDLPTEDVNTIAGLVFTRLGRVPTPGERAVWDDAEIEVLAIKGRRIHRVRIQRRNDEPTSAGPPGNPSAVVPKA